LIPPTWLDEHGQRVGTRPCPRCHKKSPEHRYRFEHLPSRFVNWCGHSQEFVAWPEADGYWTLVPVFEEAA
jgi:hypothetical protein